MKNITFLFFTLILLSGCNKNSAYMRDLEKFISDVEMNYKEYSKNDWVKKDKEFVKLSETRFAEISEKLTPDERSRANELLGVYQALKIKKGIGDFKNGIKDLFEQGIEAVKNLLPDSASIKDAMERRKSEINRLLNDPE